MMVAHLQSEFRHEIGFLLLSYEKSSENVPKHCLSLYSVGPKNPAKFLPNFLQTFPPKKQKNTDELLQEHREMIYLRVAPLQNKIAPKILLIHKRKAQRKRNEKFEKRPETSPKKVKPCSAA